jgi:addiction module RelB/DinJ family antitoxin
MVQLCSIVAIRFAWLEVLMSTTLTVRMDEKLKRDFAGIVEEIGLDVPTVIRMLAVQTVRQRRVPLSLSAAQESPDTLDFLDSVRADWGEW